MVILRPGATPSLITYRDEGNPMEYEGNFRDPTEIVDFIAVSSLPNAVVVDQVVVELAAEPGRRLSLRGSAT